MRCRWGRYGVRTPPLPHFPPPPPPPRLLSTAVLYCLPCPSPQAGAGCHACTSVWHARTSPRWRARPAAARRRGRAVVRAVPRRCTPLTLWRQFAAAECVAFAGTAPACDAHLCQRNRVIVVPFDGVGRRTSARPVGGIPICCHFTHDCPSKLMPSLATARTCPCVGTNAFLISVAMPRGFWLFLALLCVVVTV